MARLYEIAEFLDFLKKTNTKLSDWRGIKLNLSEALDTNKANKKLIAESLAQILPAQAFICTLDNFDCWVLINNITNEDFDKYVQRYLKFTPKKQNNLKSTEITTIYSLDKNLTKFTEIFTEAALNQKKSNTSPQFLKTIKTLKNTLTQESFDINISLVPIFKTDQNNDIQSDQRPESLYFRPLLNSKKGVSLSTDRDLNLYIKSILSPKAILKISSLLNANRDRDCFVNISHLQINPIQITMLEDHENFVPTFTVENFLSLEFNHKFKKHAIYVKYHQYSLFDLSKLNADYLLFEWNDALSEQDLDILSAAISQNKSSKIILTKCKSPSSLFFGLNHEVSLFSGEYFTKTKQQAS